MVGLQNGLKSSLVLARKPSMSAGRYCIRLSRGELLMHRLVGHLVSILDTEFPSLTTAAHADGMAHA